MIHDLLALGKGLSAGYSPAAAVLLREHLVDAIRTGSGVAPFGHTFSGNPAGAAACLAVPDYMDRHQVLENVRSRGAQLQAGLLQLATRFPFVADVRGRGLLWGFEFVMDARSGSAPVARDNAADTFVDECFDRGLIVYPGAGASLTTR